MSRRILVSSCAAAILSITAAAASQSASQAPTQSPVPSGAQGTDPQRPATGSRAAAAGTPITVVGCLQREADYRRANDGGRGGALGTGAGVGNEFVLTRATMGSASAPTAADAAPPADRPAGTAGTTAPPRAGSAPGATTSAGTATTGARTMAYSLTGQRESELEQYVGQRVEIMGTMASAAPGSTRGPGTSAPGTTTSGATRGAETTSTENPAAGAGGGSAAAGTTGGAAAGGTTPGRPSATGSTAGPGGSVGDLQEIEVSSFRAVGGSCE